MEENNENYLQSLQNTPQLEGRSAFRIYQDIESFTPKTPVTKTAFNANRRVDELLDENEQFSENTKMHKIIQQNDQLSENIQQNDQLTENIQQNGQLTENIQQNDQLNEDKENINPFTRERVAFKGTNSIAATPLRDITHIYQQNPNTSSSLCIPQDSLADESKDKLKTRKIR